MSSYRNKRGRRKAPSGSPLWLLGIVAVAAIAIAGIWMSSRGDGTNTGLSGEITISDAFAKREAGAFVLDVREPEEWEEYHIPGSTLIPLGELKNRVNELPHDQDIVVVCRSGNRSQEGRDILVQAGFDRVTSMSGGLTGWRSAGYPTESGE